MYRRGRFVDLPWLIHAGENDAAKRGLRGGCLISVIAAYTASKLRLTVLDEILADEQHMMRFVGITQICRELWTHWQPFVHN